jgi:hypothetical protein
MIHISRRYVMKKTLVLRVMTALALLSISANGMYAEGLYVDVGASVGWATQEFNSFDFIDWVKDEQGVDPTEFAMFGGGKLGGGFGEEIPIYIVADFETVYHHAEWSGSSGYKFNTYLLGGGLVWYPAEFIQIGGNFGYVWVDNKVSTTQSDINKAIFLANNNSGFGFSLSIGFDIFGFLLGIEYCNTTVKLSSNTDQNTSYFGFLVKYVFRSDREDWDWYW